MCASPGSDVLVVGMAGAILHYDGLVWSPMDSGAKFDLTNIRPLVTRLLQVPAYRQAYEDKLRDLMAGPFSQASLDAEIDSVFTLIRDDVLIDTMKEFSNRDFNDSIVRDIPPLGPDRIFGLKPFVPARIAAVTAQLP